MRKIIIICLAVILSGFFVFRIQSPEGWYTDGNEYIHIHGDRCDFLADKNGEIIETCKIEMKNKTQYVLIMNGITRNARYYRGRIELEEPDGSWSYWYNHT